MTCRRKTKKERELVADIHKLFGTFCTQSRVCWECEFKDEKNCLKAYVNDLLDKNEEEEQ